MAETTDILFGDKTRHLKSAWSRRVDDKNVVDDVDIRRLFNDLDMFPSKSQVYEMVHCAREGDNGGNFLTFGEFCFYATEMRRHYDCVGEKSSAEKSATDSDVSTSTSQQRKCSYDVFLGGSCNPTTWRHDDAIPFFKSHNITFYNPQQSNWVPEMIELEHQAKQTSKVLFFVVSNMTRNVASMIEMSYLASKKTNLVAVLDTYKSGHTINGAAVSDAEHADLMNGVTVLHDLLERQGLPVFTNLLNGLESTAKVLKDNVSLDNLGLSDGTHPVRHPDFQIGDSLVRLREAFDAVDTSRSGRLGVSDLAMAFRIHAHRDLKKANVAKLAKGGVDFETFCCIVSEFKFGTDEDVDNKQQQPAEKFKKRRHVRNFFEAFFCKAQQGNNGSSSGVGQHQETAIADLRTTTRTTSSVSDATARRGSSIRDVYLGGALTWRREAASVVLEKHGLTYFSPPLTASEVTCRRRMPMMAAAMDNSRVLLFVIPGTSRAVSAMNEAAFYIGQEGRNVVLCVESIPDDQPVDPDSECLTKAALKDYNRGRAYLSDIANREGVPVFDNIDEALDCLVEKCKAAT